MLSPLRNRFGIPGVISVIALVFAMLGGAYAANNSDGGGKATASAKGKPGPRGPRGKQGPAGPAGPQGPAGPAGAKGDTGAAGADGKNGAAGATGKAGAKGTTGPKGTTGAKGATGAKGTTGPKGPTGPSGVTETLPSGKTEIGVWGGVIGDVEDEEGISIFAPITFPVPLAAGLDAAHVKRVQASVVPECDNGVLPAPSVSNPEADPGFLCVYESGLGTLLVSPVTQPGPPFSPGAFKWGGIVNASAGFAGRAQGTWAVTAP